MDKVLSLKQIIPARLRGHGQAARAAGAGCERRASGVGRPFAGASGVDALQTRGSRHAPEARSCRRAGVCYLL